MKQGETREVQIGGIAVGHAVVESTGDGTVTFIIPAQRVTMGMRTELTPGTPEQKDTTGTETIIEGVDRSATGSGEITQPTIEVPSTPNPQLVAEAQLAPLPMAEDMSATIEDNTPEAIEFDSAAALTAVEATKVEIKSPVTITSAEGKTFTLPPGTTMEDLMEPAANE